MILVLNKSPFSTIFSIVWFPGCPKFILSGDPPVYVPKKMFGIPIKIWSTKKMRNWPDNWYTKETDQKYMDAARIKDHSKLSSTKSKFGGQLFFIYLLCTSCKREIILEIKTKNDPNSKA